MRKSVRQEPWLKAFHWEALADLHLDLSFLRHQFIQAVNKKVAVQAIDSAEVLDQLAEVDELLQAAGDSLEQAKHALFESCCASASLTSGKRKPNT